jgi:sugar-specific transcriptional regulator TrmB
MNTEILFQTIGLNIKESKILSYLYTREKSLASTISKELDIPKSTVLFILYNLEKKELVIKEKKGNSFIFKSKDPENLIRYLDKQTLDYKKKRESVLSKLPKLRRLKDLKADQKILIYDKESSIDRLKKSINEKLDNKDLRLVYSKNYNKIYSNEDFTFLITENFAARFNDLQILKKFISVISDIDETTL